MKIFVLALLVRILWYACALAFGTEPFLYHDSHHYLLLANNLLEHGAFSRSLEAPFFPDIARTPGYPLFLAPLLKMQLSIAVIAFFQLLLSALLPVVLYLTVKRLELASPLVPAVFTVFDLSLLLFAPVILTDSLFTLLFAFLMFTLASKNRSYLYYAKVAVITGIMIILRPVAQFLPILFIVWFLGNKIRLRYLTVYVLLVFALPGGWALRNYQNFTVFTVSSMGVNNLLMYNAAAIQAKVENRPFTEVQREFSREAIDAQDWRNDPLATQKFLSAAEEKSMEIITAHPEVFLNQCARNLAMYFFKPPRSYFDLTFGVEYDPTPIDGIASDNTIMEKVQIYWHKSSTLSLAMSATQVLMNLILFVLSIIGFFKLFKERKELAILLLLLIAYFWLMSVFTQTDARFRLPAIVPMGLLAAAVTKKTLRKMLVLKRVKKAVE